MRINKEISAKMVALGLFSLRQAALDCGMRHALFRNYAVEGNRLTDEQQKILDAWLAKPVPPDAGSATKGKA